MRVLSHPLRRPGRNCGKDRVSIKFEGKFQGFGVSGFVGGIRVNESGAVSHGCTRSRS